MRSLACILTLAAAMPALAEEEIGLKAPPGFTVTRYAADSLAHDIFCMTTDTAGRVVVSGPGYIKILVDADTDGVAESATVFADGPATGAQGLCFLGRDLLAVGDAGLIRYRDADGDDKADGPPETFLKIKTGGEHHAHAIRRGPDGYWYLIAGNFSEVTSGFATLPKSPTKYPHGGVVLRLTPDLAGGEILVDGFRNAYDFDFNSAGDIFVYDSDGERDVSLPWYRPTRLFHSVAGMEHGWITESWKRPDDLLDSAPVVASTGRGSPTGVAVYRHKQFPAEFRDGAFILDWTFGRVWFTPLNRNGSTYTGSAAEFISTTGQFGFAPTDIEIGPDGSMYIAVGGRGTHGTVFRVQYIGESKAADVSAKTKRGKETQPQAPRANRVAEKKPTPRDLFNPVPAPTGPAVETAAASRPTGQAKSPFARKWILQTSAEETVPNLITPAIDAIDLVDGEDDDESLELDAPKTPAEPANTPATTQSKATADAPVVVDAPVSANGWPSELMVSASDSAAVRLSACLNAPMPMASWSRVRWLPLARSLGADAFLTAVTNEGLSPASRVRAVEVLTELYDGVPEETVVSMANRGPSELRARIAWSLGVKPPKSLNPNLLTPFLGDSDPMVRRIALEAAFRWDASPREWTSKIAAALGDSDRVVRIAAARLIPFMPAENFKALSQEVRQLGWRFAIGNTLGYCWRSQLQGKLFNAYACDVARRVLAGRQTNETKLDVIRVLQVGLGDVGGGAEKTAPVFEGYAPRVDFTAHAESIRPVVTSIEKIFPTGDPVLDREISRTLALIACGSESLFDKVVSHLRPETDPIDDLHYLTVAARMPAKRTAAHRKVIAAALVDIEKKIRSQGRTQDNNWADRFGELFTGLMSHDPELYQALLKAPGFGRPSHVMFLAQFPEGAAEEALSSFKREIAADPEYPWNNDVVFVFGMKDEPESREILRSLCDRPSTASAAVMVLADNPAAEDRSRYVDGLNNGSPEVVQACLNALEKLPEEKSGDEIVSLIKLIRRLGGEKSDYELRDQAVQQLKRCTGQEFGFEFGEAGYKPQNGVVEKWSAYAMQEFPEQAAKLLGASETDLTTVRDTLASIPWDSGDETKGKAVFAARSCAQCHSGSSGLGPDLVGVASRFSKDALFTAIMLPNRDVSPRYQTTVVETKAGKNYTGLIVYESVDGVLLRNGLSQTHRIEAVDIESQRTLPTSIMPADLLKGSTPAELADLYAYLRSLSPRSTAAVPSNVKTE